MVDVRPTRCQHCSMTRPKLTEYAAGVDPPSVRMAWRRADAAGVVTACGDPRDRFRYDRRYEAYLRCWNEWAGSAGLPFIPGWW